MDQAAHGHEPVIREEEAIQHPLGIYFKIWILLFVLSAMSYAVDYYQVQGYMRWFLILFFMVLKAGLIIAVLCIWCGSGWPWCILFLFRRRFCLL
jgi:cytochrome c oxidase subunit 4